MHGVKTKQRKNNLATSIYPHSEFFPSFQVRLNIQILASEAKTNKPRKEKHDLTGIRIYTIFYSVVFIVKVGYSTCHQS